MAMSPSPYNIPTPGTTAAAAPPPPRRRHALGLPAGSVRAMLAISVVGLLALIVYLNPPASELESIHSLYAYLWAMLFLALASFFTAHGHNIAYADAGSPLGLPRGTVRILLIAGFGFIAYWLYRTNRIFEQGPEMTIPFEMLLVIPCGFFVGWFVSLLIKSSSPGGVEPFWFQDIEAWAAIVAMLMLGIDVLLRLVIYPSVSAEYRASLGTWEAVMGGIVAFYFGARSV